MNLIDPADFHLMRDNNLFNSFNLFETGVEEEVWALLDALPLRSIVTLETVGNDREVALLSCGHRIPQSMWLLGGEHRKSMRCRICYEDGIQAAGQMISIRSG